MENYKDEKIFRNDTTNKAILIDFYDLLPSNKKDKFMKLIKSLFHLLEKNE